MNLRILLVEDEPGLVMTVSDLLAGEDYEVETAGDGDIGLAKAASGKFDLVILEELLQNVWEYAGDVSSRTLDVHVAWLRQKLEDNPQTPRYIHTIRGMGYRFSL